MLRFCVLAFATLLLALSPAASALGSAAGKSSGGTPVSLTDTEAGVDASSSGGARAPAVAAQTGGEVSIAGRDEPVATLAQEPEPEPEGPGEEQPGEPGGEPQPLTGDEPGGEETVEPLIQEAPATSGALPSTGLETFKLALLGLVFLLVGARLRVIVRRRRVRASWGDPFATAAEPEARLAPDGLPCAPPAVSSSGPPEHDHEEPAPAKPVPAGALPSTATARRNANGPPPA
jgi:hypothetical protein